MDKFITLTTFQYPHEAHMVQGKLEAAGIIVFLKDELTVQSHNFLSNAVGGVKLQVMASDLEEAQLLLASMGIDVTVTTATEEGLGIISWSEKHLDKIPLLKKWPTEVRLIFLIAFVMAIIAWIVFLFIDFS